jgi:hypothetical protein
MKVLAFITGYAVVDRIIDHPKLTFVAATPPSSHIFTEIARPAVVFHHDQEGIFIARNGHSSLRGNRNLFMP